MIFSLTVRSASKLDDKVKPTGLNASTWLPGLRNDADLMTVDSDAFQV